MNTSAKKEDYNLLKQIGEGAYGKVYKAQSKKDNRIVAMKELELANEDWIPLLAEINMVVDLHHESIVNYYAWFMENQKMWLVMEYCDGGSLREIVDTLKRPLTEPEISAVSRGILESLIYVHSLNRIHRDIKAANLLLTSEGVIKLCDFGVSAQLDGTSEEYKRKTLAGSAYWMAPEIVSSAGHDTKADIWSFGITELELYEKEAPLAKFAREKGINSPQLLIVQTPRNEPPQAPDSASPLFKNFIKRILLKDPNLRPTAAELIKDPFITQISERQGKEIIRNLVAAYQIAKDNQVDEDAEEDIEEEEEEEEEDFDGEFSQDVCRTILFNNNPVETSNFGSGDATFIQVDTGTMIVQPSSNQQQNQLSDLKLEFVDQKKANEFKKAQKRHFRNFPVEGLKTLLSSMKNVAIQELKEGKISQAEVRAKYDEVRNNIIDELKRKNVDVPPDYEQLQ